MAYCVKCGVELHESLEKCPLCGTEVHLEGYDPSQAEPLYPENMETLEKRFLLRLFIPIISLIYFLPVAISLVVDNSLNGAFSWSLIVAASVALVWTLTILPPLMRHISPIIIITFMALAIAVYLLILDYLIGQPIWSVFASAAVLSIWLMAFIPIVQRKFHYYWSIAADFFIMLLYLFIVDIFASGTSWFFPLAFPLVFALFLGVSVILITFHLKAGALRNTATIFLVVGLYTIVIDLIVSTFLVGQFSFKMWSLYSFFPTAVIAAVLFLISFQKKLLVELNRRFHI